MVHFNRCTVVLYSISSQPLFQQQLTRIQIVAPVLQAPHRKAPPTLWELSVCNPAADTWEGLPAAIQEAVEAHFHGESGPVPTPTPLEKLAHHPDYRGSEWVLADEVLSRTKTGLIYKTPVMKVALSPPPIPVGTIKSIGQKCDA